MKVKYAELAKKHPVVEDAELSRLVGGAVRYFRIVSEEDFCAYDWLFLDRKYLGRCSIDVKEDLGYFGSEGAELYRQWVAWRARRLRNLGGDEENPFYVVVPPGLPADVVWANSEKQSAGSFYVATEEVGEERREEVCRELTAWMMYTLPMDYPVLVTPAKAPVAPIFFDKGDGLFRRESVVVETYHATAGEGGYDLLEACQEAVMGALREAGISADAKDTCWVLMPYAYPIPRPVTAGDSQGGTRRWGIRLGLCCLER
jgi:hypothetical protein